jgi:hypothetical protein
LLRHLVTPRNPRSHFSLINFLHCQGRLLDHLNQAWEFLLWREYAEYMAWVASHFDDVVPYGQAATSIEVVDTEDGEGGYAYCSLIASAGAASTSVITYVAPAVAVAGGVLSSGRASRPVASPACCSCSRARGWRPADGRWGARHGAVGAPDPGRDRGGRPQTVVGGADARCAAGGDRDVPRTAAGDRSTRTGGFSGCRRRLTDRCARRWSVPGVAARGVDGRYRSGPGLTQRRRRTGVRRLLGCCGR